MDTIVRWMSSSDLKPVQDIRSRCLLDSGPDLLKILSSPSCILKVAESDGQISGFIIYKNGTRKARIVEVAVSPQFRRMGVACRMVGSVSSKAAESSKHVEVFVPEENLEIQMALKKCGFRASAIHNREGLPHYKFSNEATISKK